MAYYANKVVEQAKAWLGNKEGSAGHKAIIDLYNAHKPLARGYKVKYSDAWCATFVSAVAIKLGYTSIIPTECSCSKMIDLFKKLGAWVEDESVTPEIGWIPFYDWQDNGKGDNKGVSDHVGIVEKVSGGKITVIEGNYDGTDADRIDGVERRVLSVNGKYIRGYGVPKYDAPTSEKTAEKSAEKSSGGKNATKEVNATETAKSLLKSLSGEYTVTASSLNVRNGAGTSKKILATIPRGATVQNYGYFTLASGVKWLYVLANYKGVIYRGFCSSRYLKKK